MTSRRSPSSAPRTLVVAWAGVAVFALSLIYFLHAYLIRYGRVTATGPLLPPVLVDVALFSVFALHHSVCARTALKERITQIVPAAMERSVYVWIASVLFVLVCARWRVVPGELYHVHGAAAWVGYAVQAIGLVLTVRAAAKLDALDLAGVRGPLQARLGRQPEPAPLETTGLYGFVRHPLYFAWVLVVFGTPHMTLTRLVFACTSTAYLAIAIPFEERALIARFGAQYRDYQRRVRWRMLPGLY